MKPGIKDVLKSLHDMGSTAEECISLLQTAFMYSSSKPLDDCRTAVGTMKSSESELTKDLAGLSREDAAYKPYVSVPAHLFRIAENIERLADFIEKKNRENILFSDRAITEVTFLLQRLIDILRPASDMLLARNEILRRYVEESESGISRRATEYATFHEDRLVEGLCHPRASSLYIGMLDAIKGIAWHAKEIAAKLAPG